MPPRSKKKYGKNAETMGRNPLVPQEKPHKTAIFGLFCYNGRSEKPAIKKLKKSLAISRHNRYDIDIFHSWGKSALRESNF